MPNANEVNSLIQIFEQNSVLHFTVEHNEEGRLPFLDVLTDTSESSIRTTVYVKPTNSGATMNARGECCAAYKKSVVAAFARRAVSHCSSWTDVHLELNRIRQLLTNNGFSSAMIERGISKELDKFMNTPEEKSPTTSTILRIFYKMFYHTKSHEEERAINSIFSRGVTPTSGYQTKLVCFYQPSRTSSLIMRNSHAPATESHNQTNVVYSFECPRRECTPFNTTYVGMTRTTVKRRMTYHRSQGAIYNHYYETHKERPSVQELLNSTKILERESTYHKLLIAEAVHIDRLKPNLNRQVQHQTVLPSRRFHARGSSAPQPQEPRASPGTPNNMS